MNKDNTLQDPDNCCGGPTPKNTESCCIGDADAKSAGNDGCGCSTESRSNPEIVNNTCCG